MDSGSLWLQHRLCSQSNKKITGPRWLHSRLNMVSNLEPSQYRSNLENLLWWWLVPCGGRHRSDYHTTIQSQIQIWRAVKSDKCTNNIAEYEDLILGLRKLKALIVKTCIVKNDFQNFCDFCASIGTKTVFDSVYHPQSNGVVERANGKIFTTINKRLLKDKKESGLSNYPRSFGGLTQ